MLEVFKICRVDFLRRLKMSTHPLSRNCFFYAVLSDQLRFG